MQGNFAADQAATLRERLTLVLMTHNRPAFLQRTLQYYSDYPCSILVLDSSTESAAAMAAGYPDVEYLHLPQFSYQGFQAKLTYGVNRVKTPFMAFAADDDFLLFDGLNQSLDFLDANPDYGMCHGYSLNYLAEATRVNYYRRNKKVREDYDAPRAEQRLLDYMGEFIPPFYAVTRTALLRQWLELLPEGTGFEWLEVSHVYFLLANAKARLLPIAYVVRETNYGVSEHNSEVFTVLAATDARSVADRERFADFLAGLPSAIDGLDHGQRRQLALDSFAVMAEGLYTRRALTLELVWVSSWLDPLKPPVRTFERSQYVEMPFYNQAFFDLLTSFEFLIHAMPAGRLQLQQLEPLLLRQEQLLQAQVNDTPGTVWSRLWDALKRNGFNREVVRGLAEQLRDRGEAKDSEAMFAWLARLDGVPHQSARELLGSMRSGRLLDWLEARKPDAAAQGAIAEHLALHQGGPQFGILLLDLENNQAALQETFDSLVGGLSKAFRIMVFTTGEPPMATSLHNTLHFIKVSREDYVERINQIARQTSCEWLLLAEAGDQFTATGLLRASLELLSAPDCRAVAVDEIQQQADGTWRELLRPGVNLDLLQTNPGLMARHWLLRREVLVEAGGFDKQFSEALEFDLLLRLIERGGLNGLAHLDEPLLITPVPQASDNDQARQALVRHLATRGYRAQVSAPLAGTLRIDYRHVERPLVSILLRSQDNLDDLQRCLTSILQRTRYARYEVLIADNASQSPQLLEWLAQQQGAGKVRVLQSPERLSPAALCNAASSEAKGDYLVLLAADAEVVNANWIEALLNQAQRPEVGVVGAKLQSADGKLTQAGLLLDADGGVTPAYAGEAGNAPGYLNCLAVEQNRPAVSASCLMVRRELYQALEGLDETTFAEAFGDVDLCLKAAAAGLLTVWTPQVQVIHSGVVAADPAALTALRAKWSAHWPGAAQGQLLTPGTAALDWAGLIG
ncbi:TIGR00180 family glycosyltransferase [Pseudomonas sp.]|uniref:TIGR00180 family glycosyltransferase n=1 Tax=Pseudomonas sp. TaxID=306 RepID=UPI001B05F61B|nr:TIGR00180 family glycosyltransferase [Pseudomonas sp.]MBO9550261.1 TIGR00180 family glycosyltransferase [Pseudomonas sp.]